MNQVKNYKSDYRVNVINNSTIISIEITAAVSTSERCASKTEKQKMPALRYNPT